MKGEGEFEQFEPIDFFRNLNEILHMGTICVGGGKYSHNLYF